MLKHIDSSRFRNGVETKTPTATRTLKEKISKASSPYLMLDALPLLFGASIATHRVPKTYDKATGEPKTYKWKVQPEKIEKVFLSSTHVVEADGTTTCEVPRELLKSIVNWLDKRQKVVLTENSIGEDFRMLLTPRFDKSGKFSDPIGIEVELIEVSDLYETTFEKESL